MQNANTVDIAKTVQITNSQLNAFIKAFEERDGAVIKLGDDQYILSQYGVGTFVIWEERTADWQFVNLLKVYVSYEDVPIAIQEIIEAWENEEITENANWGGYEWPNGVPVRLPKPMCGFIVKFDNLDLGNGN